MVCMKREINLDTKGWLFLKTKFNPCSSKLRSQQSLPFHSHDLRSNSPYYLPYSSQNVSLENLVLDQLIIP